MGFDRPLWRTGHWLRAEGLLAPVWLLLGLGNATAGMHEALNSKISRLE